MSANREPGGGLAAVAAVGLAVCCGLPILLGTGIAIGAAGVVLGSAVVIAVGAVLAAWGWRRLQQRRGGKFCGDLPGFPGE